MSTASSARGAEAGAGDAVVLPSDHGDGNNNGTRAPAFDSLFAYDQTSFNDVLSSIRAMERSSNQSGDRSSDQPLDQQPPPNPNHIKDWTNIDVDQTYGLHRDYNRGGFTIDRVPGDDGKIYQFESRSAGGRENDQKVYTTDANGNRVEVTDPAVIQEISRKAEKLENVSYWQKRLEELNLSDSEKKVVSDLLAAAENRDTAEVARLVNQYQGNLKGFDRIFDALLARTVITGSQIYLGLGISHKEGRATFALFYPESSRPALVVRLSQ